MSWIKSAVQTLLISGVAIVSFEAILLYFFNYKEVSLGDMSCKQYISENDFSIYKPNCEIYYKHWEHNEGVEYNFNSFGRRDGNQSNGEQLIAFIGDSFTFGAMMDIDKNYNYRSLYYFGKKQLAGHNYGVSGEQFHNVINKLKKQDFSRYKYIVYGLTPNDLFDLVDGSFKKTSQASSDSKNDFGSFRNVKKFFLSTATSRFLLHNLMNIDSVYHATYMARQPYSGYLESPISNNFENAIKTSFNQLVELEKNIKAKLVIMLLPQRAEVVAMRLGIYNNDFKNRFIKSCKESDLICFAADIEPLSKINESHFPVDGHLTIDGNDIVGRQLGGYFNKLNWD